jgi:predicted dehydrogenase
MSQSHSEEIRMSRTTRRNFLKGTAAVGTTFMISGTKSSGNILGANDRVRIAVAGLNGRGKSHIGGWMGQDNVHLVTVIDPDKNVLANTVKNVQSRAGDKYKVSAESDVRKALEDKSLDAISVATPNHWHSLITIWAAQAGKSVYVEKPMSHDVAEGRIAVEAQKKYGVVIQHGTQIRRSSSIA